MIYAPGVLIVRMIQVEQIRSYMVKKKVIIIAVAAVLIVGAIIGGTMAAFQAGTATDKTISTSSLDVMLNMKGTQPDNDGNIKSDAIKDGEVSQVVTAKNSGNKNQYVRVRLNKSWSNGTDKVFEVNGSQLQSAAIDIIPADNNDWIIQRDEQNGEDIYLYYKKVLKAGEETDPLLSGITILKNWNQNTNQYSGLSVKVRYDADAIQTTAAKDAMLAEWGVIAEFDSEGNITAITDQ